MQFLYLLRQPQDAWTKVLRKVASDIVHRIFDAFSKEDISANQNLTKELFLQCFQQGKSSSEHFLESLLIQNESEMFL